jgi:hypothetical protein
MDADLSYYRRRSVEENAAARAADDSRVRAVHLELARRYEQRCATMEAELRLAHLHLVSAA